MAPNDRWRWDGIVSCVLFASTLVFIATVARLRVGPLVWLVVWVIGAWFGWSGLRKGRRASRVIGAMGLAANGLGLLGFAVLLAFGEYRIWNRKTPPILLPFGMIQNHGGCGQAEIMGKTGKMNPCPADPRSP